MRIFSVLLLLLSCSLNVSCEFIPPPDEVCLGDSITFHCVLTGAFSTVQLLIINSTSFSLSQINLNSFSGLDVSRISATIDNTQNQVFIYTDLRANITLVNITKEDNNTLIGCSAGISGTSDRQEESDTLILASPPPAPSIQIMPIPGNCTVKVSWPHPTQPRRQYITDSVTTSLSISDQTYFSAPLTAGQESSYTLSAEFCLGSVTATVQFTPPSQPETLSCSATYGTEDRRLVIQILGYTSQYSIETSFSLFNDSDNEMVLSGNFSETPLFYSRDMFDIPVTSNYTVRLSSALRDCIASNSVACEAKLNITLMAPITTTSMPVTTNSTPATTPTKPSTLPPYITYIIIAVILVIVLIALSLVILLLGYLVHRSKTTKSKSIPKNAKRLTDPPSVPQFVETDANGEELHYIQPVFSQVSNPAKPKAGYPQTLYADINQASIAMQTV